MNKKLVPGSQTAGGMKGAKNQVESSICQLPTGQQFFCDKSLQKITVSYNRLFFHTVFPGDKRIDFLKHSEGFVAYEVLDN